MVEKSRTTFMDGPGICFTSNHNPCGRMLRQFFPRTKTSLSYLVYSRYDVFRRHVILIHKEIGATELLRKIFDQSFRQVEFFQDVFRLIDTDGLQYGSSGALQ